MTALQGKTALVTGASRGIGRATGSALAEAGAHVLVHTAVPPRTRNLSSPASREKGDAPTQSRRTWKLQTEQHYWREKFARSLATDWMCSFPTPESVRLQPSRIIRSRILTNSLQRMCGARFSWCSNFCPSSAKARTLS